MITEAQRLFQVSHDGPRRSRSKNLNLKTFAIKQHLTLAPRVLAWTESQQSKPTRGPRLGGSRVHGSETRSRGRTRTKEEKTAAEHSAPPDGGQGEEQRLGGTPSSREHRSGLQEGTKSQIIMNDEK